MLVLEVMAYCFMYNNDLSVADLDSELISLELSVPDDLKSEDLVVEYVYFPPDAGDVGVHLLYPLVAPRLPYRALYRRIIAALLSGGSAYTRYHLLVFRRYGFCHLWRWVKYDYSTCSGSLMFLLILLIVLYLSNYIIFK